MELVLERWGKVKPSRSNYLNCFPSNVNSACAMKVNFITCRLVIGELLTVKSKLGSRKGKLTKKGGEHKEMCVEIEVGIIELRFMHRTFN